MEFLKFHLFPGKSTSRSVEKHWLITQLTLPDVKVFPCVDGGINKFTFHPPMMEEKKIDKSMACLRLGTHKKFFFFIIQVV